MPRLQLPPKGSLAPNSSVDPLRFYYKPIVGRIFVARLDLGLQLVESRFRRLLEVGYGSGLLLPTLCALADETYGVDLQPEPPGLRDALERLGARPTALVQADLCELPFPAARFDGVVAFSILEHLRAEELERAVAELDRVIEPGGRLLVGCPAVHRAMNAAFAAIGFHGIEDHHFSGIDDVLRAAAPYFTVERKAALPRPFGDLLPLGWAPYTAVLLRRRAGRAAA
jgi:SAM-dependent methyltransferase